MIIVKLMGGLGNQMFQYAVGRTQAVKKQCELLLDITSYEVDSLRRYQLHNFNIDAKIATREQLARFKFLSPFNRFVRLLWPGAAVPHIVKEAQFHYSADIPDLQGDIYLDGYWQTEKYFANCQNHIRQAFTLKEVPSTTCQRIEQQITRGASLSLHIRRGDYVTDRHTNQFHGTCSLEYYFAAHRFIRARNPDVTTFVFSDDIEWSKRNLSLEGEVQFVESTNGKDYEEIYLMSLCQYFIIANSTFSWWGAWLSINSGKMVIAPQQWFVNNSLNDRDIIPESWIRM